MSDYVKKMVDNVLIAYVKTDQKDARMIAQWMIVLMNISIVFTNMP